MNGREIPDLRYLHRIAVLYRNLRDLLDETVILLSRRGIFGVELAKATGFTEASISRILRGKQRKRVRGKRTDAASGRRSRHIDQ